MIDGKKKGMSLYNFLEWIIICFKNLTEAKNALGTSCTVARITNFSGQTLNAKR